MDALFVDGKIVSGTALDRVNQALVGTATVDVVQVYAGDVADVCRALGESKGKLVEDLAKESAGYVGKRMTLRVSDARALVSLFSQPVASPPADTAKKTSG